MDPMPAGVAEMQSLHQAGFTATEIDKWQSDTRDQLHQAGFSEEEVMNYFGEKEPDMTPVEQNFNANIQKRQQAELAKKSEAPAQANPDMPMEQPMPEQADTFLEAIEAGFDMSVSGLMMDKPDMVLPEHADRWFRIASMVGGVAGDLPAMMAGAFGGGVAGGIGGAVAMGTAGSVVPVAGTLTGIAAGGLGGSVAGAGYGAFALPEAMRTYMMQNYEKGTVKSFSDFWERSAAIAINQLKAGTVGAFTAMTGGTVGVLAKGAGPVLKTGAQLLSEVATMTTLGAAMEGKVPEPDEFIDAAFLVLGMHGSIKGVSRVRNMYSKTGTTPIELADKAQHQPVLKQKLLCENPPPEMQGQRTGPRTLGPEPEVIPTTKPLKEPSNPDLPPEVNNILGKTGEKAPPVKGEMSFNKFYTERVDKLDPVNVTVKILSENVKDLKAEDNGYILSRMVPDAKAKAKHMFEKGTIDFKTKEINGEGLTDIVKSVENPDILDAYMISKRVLEKHGQGKVTGFDVEAAKQVVKNYGPKYEAAAKRMTEFQNRVLKYVRDAGLVSKEQYGRMLELNKDYIPFKRLFEAEEVLAGKKSGRGGSLKEFKGSERDIQKPMISVVENTIELVRLSEINRAKRALVEQAEAVPGQDIIVKVKEPKQGIKVTAEEVTRELEKQGIGIENAEAVADMMIFRKQQRDLTPNQFAVWRDGKREVFETKPELAEALNKLGGDTTSQNMLFKIANGITTVKKFGITFTPDFILRNFMRDSLTRSVFSKYKVNPFDVFSAMRDLWKKNDAYYEWLKSGGANGAFLEMDARYVKKEIYKLQAETNFMNAARNLALKPVDFMRLGAELSEQSLRLAEFKKVRQHGGSLVEGGFASREITIDFQRVGAKMASLNAITAFQNVSIQGLDRTIRAVKDDPVGVTTKAVAAITAPSIYLWWAQKDDPRYQEIARWEKDLFWIILTDNWTDASPEEADNLPAHLVREDGGKLQINKGSAWRIPKPQELGIVFGSLPERMLEAFFTDHPDAMKEFDETLAAMITPSFVPDALVAPIEQVFNKSLHTGRDIVPQYLSGVLPEYEYVEYTSETAKTLSKMVRAVDKATIDYRPGIASPMVIDNYIQSWGGALGKYAVQTADLALNATGIGENIIKPTAAWSDIPFIKAFAVRFPQANSKSVQDFYDKSARSREVVASVTRLVDTGRTDEADKVMQENQTEYMVGKMAEGVSKGLSAQAAFIQRIIQSKEMSRDEKRQMIDGIYFQMINVSQDALFQMRDLEKPEAGE